MGKRVVVNGACGRMGQEVVRTVVNETDCELVGVCDYSNVGKDIMKILAIDHEPLLIKKDLQLAVRETSPDVLVDFTTPSVVMDNIKTGLQNSVNMIVGTTGITDVDLKTIEEMTDKYQVNALIVPNFAIGAILMMRFAAEAARYLNSVEIIELHHDQKVDSPSGTAIKTAELINENRNEKKSGFVQEIEKIEGARGADADGIHIHSVRLPGMVAHQEVIFGAEGQTLLIKHDSYNRKSFMPGVRLALNKIEEISGLVYGLENLLD
ncbi:MAG: 4-hydroxy-tetrahydrodipicolinate reductase [Halanaerobiales bacterium]